MIQHMREQYNDLNKVGALKIQHSSINQTSILQQMADHQENLVSNLKEDLNNQLKSSIVDAMMIFQQFDPPPPSLAETSASSESANFVTSTLIMETLLSHVKDLHK